MTPRMGALWALNRAATPAQVLRVITILAASWIPSNEVQVE
jgi:hypothetical protein